MGSVSYLEIFQRRWKIVAAACLIGVVVGWITTPSGSSRSVVGASYTATNILVLEEEAIASTDIPLTLSEMAARTTAGEVPERVADKLGPGEDPVALGQSISVVINDEFGTLSISATSSNGDRAAQVANGFADELVATLSERAVARHEAVAADTTQRLAKLKAQIEDVSARLGTSRNDVLTAERDALVGRYAEAYIASQDNAENAIGSAGILVLQPATPVLKEATGISVPRSGAGRAGIGGAVGLVLGLGLALLAEQVDTRLGSKRSVEQAFGLPVLAAIPRCPPRARGSVAVVGAGQDSLYAESFRQLRTSIVSRSSLLAPAAAITAASDTPASEPGAVVVGGQARPRPRLGRIATADPAPARTTGVDVLAGVGSDGQSTPRALIVLVTSAGPGEGKTTVATNLGAIFAETSKSVLVLDCDFRRPSVSAMFALPDRTAPVGGAGAHPSNGSVDLSAFTRDTSVPGVRVADLSVSGSSVEALSLARTVLAEARRQADVVVVDTSPLLTASVAAALVPDVDAVVLVARIGATTEAAATEAGERLARLEAPMFGVALLNAPTSRSAGRYYRRSSRDRSPRSGSRTKPAVTPTTRTP